MKKLRIIPVCLLLLAVSIGCSVEDGIDQDTSFLKTANIENLNVLFDISNDNSGNVTITPTSEGAITYVVDYGNGTGVDASATVEPGNNTTHAYPEGDYTVTVTAKNVSGQETIAEFPLSVVYRAPENVNITLFGDMQVSASADYAESFLVYYNDVENEEPTPLAIGEVLPAHTYPSTGAPFTLQVVALSGGEATTVVNKTLFGLPIDFEIPDVAFFGTFDDWGQQAFEVVENPDPSGINTSNTVGKYINGHAPWSGTYSPLNIPINFEYGQIIEIMVYNPDAANIGKQLNVELEWPVGGSEAQPYGAILKEAITTSGEWEILTFDFSAMGSIPVDAKFTQLVLRFNDVAEGTGEIIYIDNITLK